MYSDVKNLIKDLCYIAKTALMRFYSNENSLPNSSTILENGSFITNSYNLRYAIIAQLGITKWIHYHPKDKDLLPHLFERIILRLDEINNIGDLGLAVWLCTENNSEICIAIVEKLIKAWTFSKNDCNATDFGWILQGLVRFVQNNNSVKDNVMHVLKEAYNLLINLYSTDTNLCYRHNRLQLKYKTSRQIASLADQVYPIIALANYGYHFGKQKSTDIAISVANTICKLQGRKGQWWWHYDVKNGLVAEEYPVFSVHQDAMAPMALLAIDKIAGTDHRVFIMNGLKWLNGHNELGSRMIIQDEGIIWRDIHRRDFLKMYRLIRGLLSIGGFEKIHKLTSKNLFGYKISMECRPYHLGWILYAWADFET